MQLQPNEVYSLEVHLLGWHDRDGLYMGSQGHLDMGNNSNRVF